jgi:hypothetical protein
VERFLVPLVLLAGIAAADAACAKAARYTCLLPELALRPFRSRYHQVISWAAADAGATATRPVKNAEARPTSGDKDLSVSYGVVGDWPICMDRPRVASRK